jgi:hypothetical protein
MHMSQALKFKSKLALSLSLLMASSGAVLAQQAAVDRPAVSYPAQDANVVANAKPASAAAQEGAAPKEAPRKTVAKKTTKKATTAAKSPSKEAEEEKLTFKAPLPGEVEVSDRDYNHFIFPSAITQLVFPPNSPIVGKPVYLNGNTQALIEVQRGADKLIQMIVETEAGRVTKLYLKPRPINGITYRVDGAREAGPTPKAADSKAASPGAGAPHAEDIELLKRAVQGDIPSEFEAIALPRPTRFDRFTVVPLAGWSNGSRRIMHFSLVAVPGKTAVVSDPQFYREGINAVLLTGDHVDEDSTPQLFVVEEVTSDE